MRELDLAFNWFTCGRDYLQVRESVAAARALFPESWLFVWEDEADPLPEEGYQFIEGYRVRIGRTDWPRGRHLSTLDVLSGMGHCHLLALEQSEAEASIKIDSDHIPNRVELATWLAPEETEYECAFARGIWPFIGGLYMLSADAGRQMAAQFDLEKLAEAMWLHGAGSVEDAAVGQTFQRLYGKDAVRVMKQYGGDKKGQYCTWQYKRRDPAKAEDVELYRPFDVINFGEGIGSRCGPGCDEPTEKGLAMALYRKTHGGLGPVIG